ncbi:hypothetical protein [Candidatus Poriferisodalis sp.]|uniref:hypothetical protein n=1 Tax=Candidatus Poriferisodalis sp. TaxID=3101277 RepID=UPI003B58E2C5
MRSVLRLVEDTVLFLCGLVAGWIAVTYVPGAVLGAVAVTVVLAAGGRLLFNGTVWSAGAGLVIAGIAGAGLYVSEAVSTLGA